MANKKRNKQAPASAAVNNVKAAHNEPDATQLVPRSVLDRILDHSFQPTVLAVAAVCRSWRAVAQAHKGYYAEISLDGSATTGCRTTKDYRLKSISFAKSIVSAKRYFKRLSVAIFSPFEELDDAEDSDDAAKYDNENGPDAFALLAVRMNLDCIFQLTLELPEHCAVFVHGLLCTTPAPILEDFRFVFHGYDGPGPYAPLPANLFKSSAPLLQRVALDGVELDEPVAVFAKVQNVMLDQYSSESLPAIATNFPGMTHLELDLFDLDFDERYPPFRSSHPPLKSLGPRLRHFDLMLYASSEGIPTQLQSALEKQAIRVVQVTLSSDLDGSNSDASSDSETSSDRLPFDPAPFLQHVGKPFRVVLREHAANGIDIEIFSCGSQFRRLFRAYSREGLAERMFTGNLLLPHIRDLEVAVVLLPELWDLVDSFPRLKSLSVDFEPSRDLTWTRLATLGSVKCPSLQSICLRSAESRTVPAGDVARIVKQLLGTGGNTGGPTLVLSLAKFLLEPPADTSELGVIVKEIRYVSA